MSVALRNRIIFLALILIMGQLSLVVHATVHNSELSCQLCLSQSHHTKGIPTLKLNIPVVNDGDNLEDSYQTFQPALNLPKAYFQRAPPAVPYI
jgi:hypothetical protein